MDGKKEAGLAVRENAKGEDTAVPCERGNVTAPRASHDASERKRQKAGDEDDANAGTVDHSSSPDLGMASTSGHDPAHHTNEDDPALGHETTTLHTTPPPTQSSTEAMQTHSLTQSPLPAPLKRFTSVNINKRFLEKTSSTSGTPLGGTPLTNHTSGAANLSGSGQRRGVSPNCL